MFYDKFAQLCQERGISCAKAAEEIGLGNSAPATWKKRGSTPKGETLARVAAYFGVPASTLLDIPEDAPVLAAPTAPLVSTGEFIRNYEKILAERGIPKLEFYRQCGITTGAVSHWKQGLTVPARKTMQKIADVLNVPLESLIFGPAEESPASARQELLQLVDSLTDEQLEKALSYIAFLKQG